jgi:N-acetylglucosaminyl-diphospho-decaprenol L-rhamnosyltransferase
MNTQVSIIITSWNVRHLLRGCLQSLRGALQRLTHEVFVVDNASADGSADMVRTEFPEVTLIANSENVGFGRANNQALARCRGAYVLFLNPDTIVPEESVEAMIHFLDRRPGAAMVGPELPNGQGKLLFNWSRLSPRGIAEHLFETLVSSACRSCPAVHLKKPRRVQWLTGACWLVRRDVFERIGRFDEHLFLYGEEPDVCHRLRKADWEVWFLREVQVIHFKGQSIQQLGSAFPLFLKSICYVIAKIVRNRRSRIAPVRARPGRALDRAMRR